MRHYHAVLTDRDISEYDFDACWRDYRIGILNAFWREIGALSLQVGNGARGSQRREAFALRTSADVTDHDGLALLDGLSRL